MLTRNDYFFTSFNTCGSVLSNPPGVTEENPKSCSSVRKIKVFVRESDWIECEQEGKTASVEASRYRVKID